MIAAIIPARGGSKRLPGKNLARIGGSTLVELAIRCAQDVEEIDIIAVSTDCPAIASEAFRCGALVIPRPAELATDDATSEEVALHAAFRLALEKYDDSIVLLQPTSPLRTADDVRRAIALHEEHAFGPVMTGVDDKTPNGAVYVATVPQLERGKKFSDGRVVKMDADRSIDIDSAEDLARAQEWWARRAVA